MQEQTAVSHSSTESDVMLLDAGLRMDGITENLVIEVLHSFSNHARAQRDQSRDKYCDKRCTKKTKKQSNKSENVGSTKVDYVLPTAKLSRHNALPFFFEDNEALIKMIIKCRSRTMRHVSRNHRVALDWLFVRIKLEAKKQIKYVCTRNQLADTTEGTFNRDEWHHFSVRLIFWSMKCFPDNLVDEEVSAPRWASPSSSHEPLHPEPQPKVISGTV